MNYHFDTERFARLVINKRNNRTLGTIAKEADVTIGSLFRAQLGTIPQWKIYLKICKWLDVCPKDFIIVEGDKELNNCDRIVSILKAEPAFSPQLVDFLCLMIENAYEQYVETRQEVKSEDNLACATNNF
jgi:hypothetical protein